MEYLNDFLWFLYKGSDESIIHKCISFRWLVWIMYLPHQGFGQYLQNRPWIFKRHHNHSTFTFNPPISINNKRMHLAHNKASILMTFHFEYMFICIIIVWFVNNLHKYNQIRTSNISKLIYFCCNEYFHKTASNRLINSITSGYLKNPCFELNFFVQMKYFDLDIWSMPIIENRSWHCIQKNKRIPISEIKRCKLELLCKLFDWGR